MAVSKKIRGLMEQGSWTRKMFEEGISLKRRYFDDNVPGDPYSGAAAGVLQRAATTARATFPRDASLLAQRGLRGDQVLSGRPARTVPGFVELGDPVYPRAAMSHLRKSIRR